jgi:hypothetical protein
MNEAVSVSAENRDFVDFVDGLAATLAPHSPTFEALVAALPGVLPHEALAALRRMGGCHAERLAEDAVTDRAGATIDQGALLPLPHPLDSEFRFDETTARILAEALVCSTRAGDEILLIGVPSVAVELGRMHVDRQIRFLGPDNIVTDAVSAVVGDQRLRLGQGPGGTAAAALLDPPWYARPMNDLIHVAAAGCRAGAVITLIVPPLGTRPEIAADRSIYLQSAINAGLTPTGASGPACYRTPLFELAAMERQGIARLPSWRRGEALEFIVDGEIRSAAWTAPRAVEFSAAGIRLRLVRGEARGGPLLQPIESHEVFSSVSARAERRSLATLWTTANRAFAIDYDLAHAALAHIADAHRDLLHLRLSERENDLEKVQRVAAADELIHQLIELIGREANDARRLAGDGAWLMTEMDWRS